MIDSPVIPERMDQSHVARFCPVLPHDSNAIIAKMDVEWADPGYSYRAGVELKVNEVLL